MTDDFLNLDINWDDEESLFDQSEPEGGKKHFGHLRLYIPSVTKYWEQGKYFTIPGVVGGDFNEKAPDGNMMFKSYTKGGNDKLYVLVATKQDQNGQDYQIVKQYPNKKYRKGDKLIFADVIFPSLKKLSDTDRKALMTNGAYAEWDEVETGQKFETNDGKEKDIMAWANFKVFASKEEMDKASKEFFSQFSKKDNSNSMPDYYPQVWDSADFDWLNFAKNKIEEGVTNPKELAVSVMLVDDGNGRFVESKKYEDGKPATAINGQPVPVAKVVAELLNVPEETVSL